MLTKTLSEVKKKQRASLIKAMNNDIGSIDSAKDSWNPAQISERAKDISYIRSLVDSWNPAQLNEALKMLDLPVIDTWNPAQIEEQRRNLVFYLAERTLTGNPITLKILGNLTPEVTGLKVTMNPIQSGTGEPSPTNIRPITGRTEASVDLESVDITTLYNGQIQSDGNFIRNNNRISNANSSQMNTYFLKKGTHTLTFNKLNQSAPDLVECTVLTKNDNFEIVDNFATTWHSLPYTFELTADAYVYFTARKDYETVLNTADYKTLIIDETHTHQYSETIYGGVDDFVNGGATVNKGFIIYNGSENWGVSSGRFRLSKPSDAPNLLDVENGAVSNLFGYSTSTTTADNEFYIGTNYISVRCDSCADLTAFTTLLASNNMQLAYNLATPTTISTSAEEITLLKGTNVLSTDGDSIELKYKQNF